MISIIAPVYNEEEVLHSLYERIREVMEGTGEAWELMLVNDGSRDRSAEIIGELNELDGRVRGLSFSRNFGFQEAVTAGLHHVSGDAVVLTDADLQDPPEVIPKMIDKWNVSWARQKYGLDITGTPHILIFDDKGNTLSQDVGNERTAYQLLYQWMNAELRKG